MLELDILLGNFLKEAFLTLSREEQHEFIHLLSFNDQELFMWFINSQSPPIKMVNIINKILSHARSRSTS